MAQLSLVSITHNSIEVCITGLDPNYSNPNRLVTWYLNELSYTDMYIPNGTVQSPSYTFSNLSPSTTYRVMAVLIYYNSDGSLGGTPMTYYAEYTTNAYDPGGGGGGTTILPFEWDTPKMAGQPFDLRASEWNRLVAKIEEIRTARGLFAWGLSQVLSGTQLTADMYNSCIYALRYTSGDHSLGPLVNSGDPVTAYCLNYLRVVTNSLIG